MARSRRRTSRRTTSQRAAGLIALALPAPVQRIADTRLGSLLMLVGVPAMIVFGLLNVTWVDGFPTFTFNRNKAAELKNVAREHLNNLEYQAATQNWGQSTVDFLHAAQGPNHEHHFPASPSTQPQASSPAYDWQQQQMRQQQQQHSTLYQQPNYQQPQYQQQQYQQPQYQQPQYQQPQYQQWPATGNQQAYQGSYAPAYGQSQAQSYSYPAPAPLKNNSHPLPSTSGNGQSPYNTQSGQLGRY